MSVNQTPRLKGSTILYDSVVAGDNNNNNVGALVPFMDHFPRLTSACAVAYCGGCVVTLPSTGAAYFGPACQSLPSGLAQTLDGIRHSTSGSGCVVPILSFSDSRYIVVRKTTSGGGGGGGGGNSSRGREQTMCAVESGLGSNENEKLRHSAGELVSATFGPSNTFVACYHGNKYLTSNLDALHSSVRSAIRQRTALSIFLHPTRSDVYLIQQRNGTIAISESAFWTTDWKRKLAALRPNEDRIKSVSFGDPTAGPTVIHVVDAPQPETMQSGGAVRRQREEEVQQQQQQQQRQQDIIPDPLDAAFLETLLPNRNRDDLKKYVAAFHEEEIRSLSELKCFSIEEINKQFKSLPLVLRAKLAPYCKNGR